MKKLLFCVLAFFVLFISCTNTDNKQNQKPTQQELFSNFLMLEETGYLKEPNKNCWSPIGGKLEMRLGESPFECAIRETREEIGLEISEGDLHLFSMISEKAYEGSCHWLMFLFL